MQFLILIWEKLLETHMLSYDMGSQITSYTTFIQLDTIKLRYYHSLCINDVHENILYWSFHNRLECMFTLYMKIRIQTFQFFIILLKSITFSNITSIY